MNTVVAALLWTPLFSLMLCRMGGFLTSAEHASDYPLNASDVARKPLDIPTGFETAQQETLMLSSYKMPMQYYRKILTGLMEVLKEK